MIPQKVSDYAEMMSSAESEILYRINRETNIRMAYPQMLSGHLQGLFLRMISRMIRPKRILEIGSYTGYSAICLAEGMPDEGILHTIESNPELEDLLKNNFREAGYEGKIILHMGNALSVIPGIRETFDLVFLDADKENYPDYYDLVMDKLKPGGFLLADNVLWGGKILENPPLSDRESHGIIRFNEKVRDDDRVEQLLLPVRDGIMIVHKK
jgi:caffeoyl-CoA O-methyltransferase